MNTIWRRQSERSSFQKSRDPSLHSVRRSSMRSPAFPQNTNSSLLLRRRIQWASCFRLILGCNRLACQPSLPVFPVPEAILLQGSSLHALCALHPICPIPQHRNRRSIPRECTRTSLPIQHDCQSEASIQIPILWLHGYEDTAESGHLQRA